MSDQLKLVDRLGLSYGECLGYQAERLEKWRTRINPEILNAVKEYCLRTNLPATSSDQKHRVYRGGDIDELVREWPDINEYVFVPKDPSAPPCSIVEGKLPITDADLI